MMHKTNGKGQKYSPKARKIINAWTFFRRGHGVYLTFILSFLNFITIQYRLMIDQIPFLKNSVLGSLYIFTLVFLIAYGLVSVALGYVDYKRGAVISENVLSNKANPYVDDTVKTITLQNEGLALLAEGKNELARQKFTEASGVIKKWDSNIAY